MQLMFNFISSLSNTKIFIPWLIIEMIPYQKHHSKCSPIPLPINQTLIFKYFSPSKHVDLHSVD